MGFYDKPSTVITQAVHVRQGRRDGWREGGRERGRSVKTAIYSFDRRILMIRVQETVLSGIGRHFRVSGKKKKIQFLFIFTLFHPSEVVLLNSIVLLLQYYSYFHLSFSHMHACITTKVIIIISKRQLFHKWRSLLHHICHLRFASWHRRPPPVTSGENIEIVWADRVLGEGDDCQTVADESQ